MTIFQQKSFFADHVCSAREGNVFNIMRDSVHWGEGLASHGQVGR